MILLIYYNNNHLAHRITTNFFIDINKYSKTTLFNNIISLLNNFGIILLCSLLLLYNTIKLHTYTLPYLRYLNQNSIHSITIKNFEYQITIYQANIK